LNNCYYGLSLCDRPAHNTQCYATIKQDGSIVDLVTGSVPAAINSQHVWC